MGISIYAGAVHYSAVLLIATFWMGTSLPVSADTPAQRQELAAALRQLDALQRVVAQSAATTPLAPNERYYFDYPRLLGDLARVRSGIQFYLSPSRAQPRDATELNSDYRQESPPKYHSTSLKLKEQP